MSFEGEQGKATYCWDGSRVTVERSPPQRTMVATSRKHRSCVRMEAGAGSDLFCARTGKHDSTEPARSSGWNRSRVILGLACCPPPAAQCIVGQMWRFSAVGLATVTLCIFCPSILGIVLSSCGQSDEQPGGCFVARRVDQCCSMPIAAKGGRPQERALFNVGIARSRRCRMSRRPAVQSPVLSRAFRLGDLDAHRRTQRIELCLSTRM